MLRGAAFGGATAGVMYGIFQGIASLSENGQNIIYDSPASKDIPIDCKDVSPYNDVVIIHDKNTSYLDASLDAAANNPPPKGTLDVYFHGSQNKMNGWTIEQTKACLDSTGKLNSGDINRIRFIGCNMGKGGALSVAFRFAISTGYTTVAADSYLWPFQSTATGKWYWNMTPYGRTWFGGIDMSSPGSWWEFTVRSDITKLPRFQ